VSASKPEKKDRGEHIFAIVLVLFIGLFITCVAVITFGMMKFGARKQIECHCPDGSTITEVTSAMLEADKVCPGICAERQRAATAPK
jgi:hypothetical protein